MAATSVVALLFAADGFATWLGVSQAPAAPSGLARYVAASEAEGTVAFVMTVRTPALHALQRTTGQMDFADRSGRALSEASTPQSLPQYTETVVVHGAAYERPGADRADGPHFDGAWSRVAIAIAVPPYAPLAGAVAAAPLAPALQRVGGGTLGRVPVTEYLVASYGVSCPPGAGPATAWHETTWVWVDGQGRIRRWENVAVARFGSSSVGVRATAVVTFGRFGSPVSVTTPGRVLGVAPPAAKPANPYAGCLVTPG